MEASARKAGSHKESYAWEDHATLLNSNSGGMDSRSRNWGLGGRPFTINRCSDKSVLCLRGIKMINHYFQKITDYMCYGILAFSFAASFFTGAYSHVMKEMAAEAMFYNHFPMAALTEIEVIL